MSNLCPSVALGRGMRACMDVKLQAREEVSTGFPRMLVCRTRRRGTEESSSVSWTRSRLRLVRTSLSWASPDGSIMIAGQTCRREKNMSANASGFECMDASFDHCLGILALSGTCRQAHG